MAGLIDAPAPKCALTIRACDDWLRAQISMRGTSAGQPRRPLIDPHATGLSHCRNVTQKVSIDTKALTSTQVAGLDRRPSPECASTIRACGDRLPAIPDVGRLQEYHSKSIDRYKPVNFRPGGLAWTNAADAAQAGVCVMLVLNGYL